VSLGQGEARQQAGLLSCRPKSPMYSLAKYMYNISPSMRGQTFTSRLCSLRAGSRALLSQKSGARLPVALPAKGSVRARRRPAMDLQMSIGVLTRRTVDRAMAPHVPALIDCFERVGMHASPVRPSRSPLVCRGQRIGFEHSRYQERVGQLPCRACLIDAGMRYRVSSTRGQPQDRFRVFRFSSTGEMPC